jgi:DNA-nicking Smr family endonuclease
MGRPRDHRPKEHERALWQAAMHDVKPLKRAKTATRSMTASTAPPEKPKKAPVAPPRPAMPAPGSAPSIVITKAAPEISHGRAAGIDRRSAEKLRRGRLAIEGRLDLHGMTQEAAAGRLASFLERAESQGKRCVLVITGKGLASGGVLRDQVPRWLNLPPNRGRVLAFDYARPQHGGGGALYVLLKRRRET